MMLFLISDFIGLCKASYLYTFWFSIYNTNTIPMLFIRHFVSCNLRQDWILLFRLLVVRLENSRLIARKKSTNFFKNISRPALVQTSINFIAQGVPGPLGPSSLRFCYHLEYFGAPIQILFRIYTILNHEINFCFSIWNKLESQVAQWVVCPIHTRLVPGSKHDRCKNPLVFAMIASWTIGLAAQWLNWFPSSVQPNTLKGLAEFPYYQ